MKNVLVDYHHPQLFQSLKLLFEKRLGMKLYRPKGKEWLDAGYYSYYGDVAKSLEQLEGGDVTIEEAVELGFDYALTTIPMSEGCFNKFIRERGLKTKQIMVVGNVNHRPEGLPILTSTSYQPPGSCFFHQEFEDIHQIGIMNRNVVTSFLSNPSTYLDYPIWRANFKSYPNIEWMEYGHGAQHGYLDTTGKVTAAMAVTTWVWHSKHVGEGYGHVVHLAAAIGRPIMVRKHQFAGSVAEKYMIHGITCLDLDQCPNAASFAYYLDKYTNKIDKMGNAIHAIFEAAVDFNEEAKNVEAFLAKLG